MLTVCCISSPFHEKAMIELQATLQRVIARIFFGSELQEGSMSHQAKRVSSGRCQMRCQSGYQTARYQLVRRRNVKWRAADATELELPAASFDVVFSNWLLMYLSDDEVSKLASDALRWVRYLDLAYLF